MKETEEERLERYQKMVERYLKQSDSLTEGIQSLLLMYDEREKLRQNPTPSSAHPKPTKTKTTTRTPPQNFYPPWSQAKPTKRTPTRNLFGIRFRVKDKLCNVIVDGGSETNTVSRELVDRLGLPTFSWLDESKSTGVREQCLVKFVIGRYVDEVLCDVNTMDDCHILLGRPWQTDRRARHNGYNNTYTITYKNKKLILHSLPPHQLAEFFLKRVDDSVEENGDTPSNLEIVVPQPPKNVKDLAVVSLEEVSIGVEEEGEEEEIPTLPCTLSLVENVQNVEVEEGDTPSDLGIVVAQLVEPSFNEVNIDLEEKEVEMPKPPCTLDGDEMKTLVCNMPSIFRENERVKELHVLRTSTQDPLIEVAAHFTIPKGEGKFLSEQVVMGGIGKEQALITYYRELHLKDLLKLSTCCSLLLRDSNYVFQLSWEKVNNRECGSISTLIFVIKDSSFIFKMPWNNVICFLSLFTLKMHQDHHKMQKDHWSLRKLRDHGAAVLFAFIRAFNDILIAFNKSKMAREDTKQLASLHHPLKNVDKLSNVTFWLPIFHPSNEHNIPHIQSTNSYAHACEVHKMKSKLEICNHMHYSVTLFVYPFSGTRSRVAQRCFIGYLVWIFLVKMLHEYLDVWCLIFEYVQQMVVNFYSMKLGELRTILFEEGGDDVIMEEPISKVPKLIDKIQKLDQSYTPNQTTKATLKLYFLQAAHFHANLVKPYDMELIILTQVHASPWSIQQIQSTHFVINGASPRKSKMIIIPFLKHQLRLLYFAISVNEMLVSSIQVGAYFAIKIQI